jgi:hypothetical protein
MARRDFPLSINRRRLLATGAAVVTSAIVPRAESAKAALANAAQPASLPAEAPALKLCAATARRLMEIARRNELRREQSCPFRRLRKSYAGSNCRKMEEFERFQAAYGKAVWQEVLKARREAVGNPNWRPNWMEGVRYQSEIYKILRQRFYAARHGVCWGEAVRSRAIRSQSGHIGSCVA